MLRDSRVLEVAALLIEVDGDIQIGDMQKGESGRTDGWLDLYSHEPFQDCRCVLMQVVESIRPHLYDGRQEWEFRLFCPDGYLCCYSDGRLIDDDGVPITGTNAFPTKGT